MGDRANIKIQSNDETPMFFYTHWTGYKLPETLQTALARGIDRWDDPTYLNRIIFSEMIKDNISEETGFGLSVYVGDGDDRIITVDPEKQTVEMLGATYTFQEFIDLKMPVGF